MSSREPSIIDRLPPEVVFAIAERSDSSADAAALCRARWGDDVINQAGVKDFLHRAKLWGHAVQVAREHVQRPDPAALVRQKHATIEDCQWLGVYIGLWLTGWICASTLGSALITAGTPASIVTSPTSDPAALREHLKGQLLGELALIGWIPAGYLVGRFALAPACTRGALAWGQAAAVKQLLGESRAVLPLEEQRKLYFDLFKNLTVAAGCFSLCGGVLLGALLILGIQAHYTAAAVFAYGLTKTAGITIGCAVGAFVGVCYATNIIGQARTYAAEEWTRCFVRPGAMFRAEGYHAYIDALVKKLEFVPGLESSAPVASSHSRRAASLRRAVDRLLSSTGFAAVRRN